MSEVKVNKISPRSGTDVTLGDSGDTFTIPSGATINNQGTAVNFGATGSASWVTTVKTSTFTAVAGEGYFINTTGGVVTVNLPAGTAGAVVAIKDYAGTFDTNKVTLVQNGSDKIAGSAINATLTTEGIAVTLIFIDSTQGWLVTDSGLQSEAPQATFITATGGTITTSGNFKIHTFTGPGTFTVCSVGNPSGSDSVDYIVVAGGGSGGVGQDAGGAGGGAGGFREGLNPGSYTASPLATTALPVTATGFPITIGAGATAVSPPGSAGNSGSPSTFSSIVSTGGGAGSGHGFAGATGGSGGGGSGGGPRAPETGKAGNTPPVSPPQGNPGGTGATDAANVASGGGGGATTAGGTVPSPSSPGGPGGAGATTSINGTPTSFAGGGGGSGWITPGSPAGNGGLGGGGGGAKPISGVGTGGAGFNSGSSGSTYTGGPAGANSGGGGGGANNPGSGGGTGGSGIVIIRYKFQN